MIPRTKYFSFEHEILIYKTLIKWCPRIKVYCTAISDRKYEYPSGYVLCNYIFFFNQGISDNILKILISCIVHAQDQTGGKIVISP